MNCKLTFTTYIQMRESALWATEIAFAHARQETGESQRVFEREGLRYYRILLFIENRMMKLDIGRYAA